MKILKSLKIDNDHFKRLYESLSRKTILNIFPESLQGSTSNMVPSMIFVITLTIAVPIASRSAQITSKLILINKKITSK